MANVGTMFGRVRCSLTHHKWVEFWFDVMSSRRVTEGRRRVLREPPSPFRHCSRCKLTEKRKAGGILNPNDPNEEWTEGEYKEWLT